MAERDGAAMRRRQRRLPSCWRHEQLSVAAALATAHQHSHGKEKTKLVERGGSEEVEHEKNALRGQHSGEAARHLRAEPQVRDAATSYVAGASLAVLPSWEHGGFDAATLSFLVQLAVLEQVVCQRLPDVQVLERPPRPPLAEKVVAMPKIVWKEHAEVDDDGFGYFASVPSTTSGRRESGVASLLLHRQTGLVQFEMSQESSGMIVGYFTINNNTASHFQLEPFGGEGSWSWMARDCYDGDGFVRC